ncbi:MAG: hypothetical protein SGJ11_02355 [Phycisphaerae bacterium]|nr:hypothetical protein [Phycisphaerae bacterium]
MLAFLDRTAPRDAWDISRLPLITPELPQSAAFRRWFVAMSFILDHGLETYGQDRLRERLATSTIESQLHPMLSRGERLEPGELFAKAWSVVGPLVRLTESEAEFARRAQQADFEGRADLWRRYAGRETVRVASASRMEDKEPQ